MLSLTLVLALDLLQVWLLLAEVDIRYSLLRKNILDLRLSDNTIGFSRLVMDEVVEVLHFRTAR